MIDFPNCKINLGLNIVSKRDDGYHNIETEFYPLPLRDALEIIPSSDGLFEFSSSGLPIPGTPESNLCVKAWNLLQEEFGLPAVKMHLHKLIPMGAGLGGGSSDGAFSLKMLNNLFDLGLENGQLMDFARKLGSDCAFFIDNQPCHAFEKGDRFEPIQVDLAGFAVVIAVPGVHVNTALAYSMVTPKFPAREVNELARLPVGNWKDWLVNDFEKPVFEQFPVIGEIKTSMYELGALYAAMSGSGSAVYGIFDVLPADYGVFRGCFVWVSPIQ